MLADLPLAAAGAPPTVPAAEVMVLAAADTPRDVLAAVAQAPGAEAPRTLTDVEDSTSLETGAVRARVYALMAGFCVLVALLVLASAIARQRAGHRTRGRRRSGSLGVGFSESRRSGRWEIGALGLGAVVATVVGGIAGVVLLLRNLALVEVPAHSVPLDVGVAVLPIAAVCAGRGGHRRPRRRAGPEHASRAEPGRHSSGRKHELPGADDGGTVLRGLRSRALLTAGSVLLTGARDRRPPCSGRSSRRRSPTPTSSRGSNEAPNTLTGLTWVYPATAATAGDPRPRVGRGRPGSSRPGRGSVRRPPVPAGDRPVRVATSSTAARPRSSPPRTPARTSSCEGECPTGPGEIADAHRRPGLHGPRRSVTRSTSGPGRAR